MKKALSLLIGFVAAFVIGTVSAAAADARIKAVAASVMYDIASFGNGAEGDARQAMLSNLAQARWDEVDNGPTVYFSYPEQPVDEVPAELE